MYITEELTSTRSLLQIKLRLRLYYEYSKVDKTVLSLRLHKNKKSENIKSDFDLYNFKNIQQTCLITIILYLMYCMWMYKLRYCLKKVKFMLTYLNHSNNHMYLNIFLKEIKSSFVINSWK